MQIAWKVKLVLLYYKYLFETPIISDNGLPLLTKNIFQIPHPVYWYLGYLSDPLFITTHPRTPLPLPPLYHFELESNNHTFHQRSPP